MNVTIIFIICLVAWLAGAVFFWTLCAGAAMADDKDGTR
jgi:hypothetical protein